MKYIRINIPTLLVTALLPVAGYSHAVDAGIAAATVLGQASWQTSETTAGGETPQPEPEPELEEDPDC